MSNLDLLHEIRLDHNRLRGFPDFLGSLKYLEIVHLNNNLLAGKLNLPLDMGDLDNLEEFTIQNNDLTGVISEFMCDLLLDVLSSDCWGSPPQVDCVSSYDSSDLIHISLLRPNLLLFISTNSPAVLYGVLLN